MPVIVIVTAYDKVRAGDLRGRRATPKLLGLKLTVDRTGPRIEEQSYTLKRP
jgi:hypothetical protein